MKTFLPKLAILVLFLVLTGLYSSSAEAARRVFTGVPIVIITTPQPISPH